MQGRVLWGCFDMSSQPTQAAGAVDPRPPNERRSRTRHPICVPAGVRLRGPGISAAPIRIVDISEDGIGLETTGPLQPERTLALDLDLSVEGFQVGSVPIPEGDAPRRLRLIGQVAWSREGGRAGVRFFSLDHAALQEIQQWLFLNAMGGAAGSVLPELLPLAQAAASGQDSEPERFPDEDSPGESGAREFLLSPLERDINAIVSRALALTGAKGAALALYEGDQLICRATGGTDTPGLGARISTDSGITGECIRHGQVMYCRDATTDPRVDHEICADLGIRSILALPLFAGQRVVGLLEVLSQHGDAFDPGDAKALDLAARPVIGLLFAEGRSEALHRGPQGDAGQVVVERAQPGGEGLAAIERRRQALARSTDPSLDPKYRLYRRGLEAVAALVVVGAVAWLVVSQSRTLASLRHPGAASPSAIAARPLQAVSAPSGATAVVTTAGTGLPAVSDTSQSLEELKSAAQAGDAAAQYAMGARYAVGEGVPQDYATAARWFTLSAKKGYARAQGMLGAYYWSGRGLQKDLKKAYFWSVLARDGNDEISKDRVDSLVAQLDRPQMLEVQQLVREWYRKHGSAESLGQAPDPAVSTVR